MIHPLSDCQSLNIGKNTNIWQYVVILPNAQIGENCNICSHCFIENDVIIGNNVTVKCGVQIWDGIEIEDNVFIGAGSSVTEGTIVKKGAVIASGVNITGSTPVYDVVNNTIITPNENGQIVIPEEAVVVPGTRTIKSEFEVGLAISTPIIKKYGGKVELEDLLRP